MQNQQKLQSPIINDFSVPKGQTIRKVLCFLKKQLPSFLQSFLDNNFEIQYEDEISSKLALFLQDKSDKEDLLFQFNAKKGVDFNIYIRPFELQAPSIFSIESKRLPPTSNKDYVSGDTGGIQRFKTERQGYASDLTTSAMIGYVQEHDFKYWEVMVNVWINEKILDNPEQDWKEQDKLVPDPDYAQYFSVHSRKSGVPIILYHFWLLMN